MKKTVSLLLTFLLLFSFAFPVFAADDGKVALTRSGSQIPIVLVGGDGAPLADENGNEIFRFMDIAKATGNVDGDAVKESVLNVVRPLLVQGMLTGNFDPYYEALYNEIAELFSDVLLDENGLPRNGSGISEANKKIMADSLIKDHKLTAGDYGLFTYQFFYDWRLDPLYTADLLNDYIEQVKALTHNDKVAIVCRCVGSNVVMSYIAKYGTASIYGLGMCGVIGLNGSEPLSESISGKFAVNLPAISRLLADLDALDYVNLDPFVTSTIDLLKASGAADAVLKTAKLTIYRHIVQGATSALALSTFFSCPMYWACVNADDYEDALLYVFGPEGSEKRRQYAGLIEKIEAYNVTVRQHLPQILSEIKQNVAHIGVISKYGYQLAPICESADELSDQFVSVYSSSFGATTSKAYDTLPDEYIEARNAEGNGKYLSPDRQVDAYTCYFRDQTWFAKGASHSNWTKAENALMYTVTTSDAVLTADDMEVSRFFVVDNKTGNWENMTEENCNTYNWEATPEAQAPTGFIARLKAYFKALKIWFALLKEKLAER